MAGIVNAGGSITLPEQEEWNQKVRTAHELAYLRSSSDGDRTWKNQFSKMRRQSVDPRDSLTPLA